MAQIIIPMSGLGQRFIDAGYTVPKPLIKVDGKPIIEHVVNLFPKEKDITFICNEDHLKNTNMREIIKSFCPNGKIHQVPAPHKKTVSSSSQPAEQSFRGPVYCVSQIFKHIDDHKPVIISYCDYGTDWEYNKFLEYVKRERLDGAIPCYRGFHPHMLGTDNYAFLRETEKGSKIMAEIREKRPFTSNRMNEYASNGTYYFRTGAIMKKYFKELMKLKKTVNGEYYVSMVYNLMVKNTHKVGIFEIKHMLQWGTPYDLEIYNNRSKYFRNITETDNSELKNENFEEKSSNENESNNEKTNNNNNNSLSDIYDDETFNNITTILPLAGRGSRFTKEGYNSPKPLIKVNELPMVIQAIKCLPQSKNNVFICLNEHLKNYELKEKILKFYPEGKVIGIDGVTEGQACTTEIGINQSNIDLEKPILITACDNGVFYNKEKYKKLVNDESNDIIVWTFKNEPTSRNSPNMYAWLDTDENDNVKSVSCKKFIDGIHNLKTSHVIIGTMFFRKAKYFIEGLKKNYQENIRTNNEFYVDDVLNQNIKEGLTVKTFQVENYICWGTPNDYKTYKYWQRFFDKCRWHPYQTIEDITYPNREKLIDNSYKCVMCLPVRDVKKWLPRIFDSINRIKIVFSDFHVCFFYDHSKDTTLKILQEFCKANKTWAKLLVNTEPQLEYRTQRIANARNKMKEYIDKNHSNTDYFIMMDADEICSYPINLNVLKYHLTLDSWDSLSFNRANLPFGHENYDMWALNYFPFIQHCHCFDGDYRVIVIMRNEITEKLNQLYKGELLEVNSAFNGFAIYRYEKFKDCRYDGKKQKHFPDDKIKKALKVIEKDYDLSLKIGYSNIKDINQNCEHTAFHLDAVRKNNARIRISGERIFDNYFS